MGRLGKWSERRWGRMSLSGCEAGEGWYREGRVLESKRLASDDGREDGWLRLLEVALIDQHRDLQSVWNECMAEVMGVKDCQPHQRLGQAKKPDTA